jgi:hypothetical protein
MSFTHYSLVFKKLPKIVPPPPNIKKYEKLTQTKDFDSLIKSEEFIQTIADFYKHILSHGSKIKVNGKKLNIQSKMMLFNLLLPWRGNTHYTFINYISLITDSLSVSRKDFIKKLSVISCDITNIPTEIDTPYIIFRNNYTTPPKKKLVIPKLNKYKLCGISLLLWASLKRRDGHSLSIVRDGNRWINCDNYMPHNIGFYTSDSFQGILDDITQKAKEISYLYLEPEIIIFVK